MTPQCNSLFWILILSFLLLLSHSATYDLTSLLSPNTAAFQIEGYASNGAFGTQVSSVGRVNEDIIDDIVIGAPTASSNGEVHVIYGKTAPSFSDITVSTLGQYNGFRVRGNAAGDYFGASVSGGDVNKDGYSDVIIGAPNKESGRGSVYIVNGDLSSAHLDLDLSVSSLQPTTTGFMIRGNAVADYFGSSVGSADINNDGYADIIIGAPGKNLNAGAVYVIYGKSKFNFPQTMDLSVTTLDPTSTGFIITGNTAEDRLGYAVGTADINKDGYADIIIGAPGKNGYTGAVYVIYGASSFPSSYTTLDPSTLNPTTGFMISGGSSGDMFGSFCGNAGDVNGDTINEIFVAASQASSNQGMVYIIYGQTGPFANIYLSSTTLDPTATGFVITGDVAHSGFGSSVAPAGDVTSDGFADIIIGAPTNNKIFVIYGGQKATRQNIALATFSLDPLVSGFTITGNSGFGSSVSVAGGFQLNNQTGLLVGAPQVNSLGYAYVIFPSKMCASGCLACSQLTTCTQCNAALGYGLVNSVCSLCPAGTYSTGITACTLNCPTGCSSCYSNSGAITCTACSSGYFQVGASCQQCPTGCTACSSSSTCTACLAAQYHLIGSICCPLSCSGCTSSTACTGCNAGYGLTGGLCQVCSSGTYLSNFGTCVSCSVIDSSCITCTSAPICTSCSGGLLLVTSTSACVAVCPGKTYKVGAICEDCSNLCENCQGTASTCTSCPLGTFLDMTSSTCGAQCPSGTYPSTASGNCQSCSVIDSNCATCTSSSTCTSCSGSLLLVTSTSSCVSSCPIKTYQTGSSCKDCSNLCVNCQGTASTCTSCPSGTFLDTASSSCGTLCPSGTYPSAMSGSCEACLILCENCQGTASTCTSCPLGTFLDMTSSSCGTSCPSGTYPSTASGKCEVCSVGCLQCPDATTCTSCDSGLALYLSKCVSSCPDGTYLANSKCESCPATCTKCQSYSFCEACHDGYTLSGSHSCDVDHQDEVENGREKAAGDTFEGSSLAGAALASGSSLPINFGLVAKIIRNLKYLNVTVSSELQVTFYSWKVSGGFLKAPKSWSSESQSKALPRVFSRYGLDPVFLINYWKPFILTVIGFVLFLVFKITEVMLTKGGQQNNSIPRKLNLAASNFALTQVYSNLDDVIFYFILDARSTEFDGAFRGFSFALALVLILTGGVILGFHGYLLQKYQSIKRDKAQTDSLPKFLYKYENVKLLFQDFKDTTIVVQSFLWIHIVRALISSLIFTTLFEYPLAQALLLLILNIGMVVFIAIKSPFKDVLGTCSQLFCEIILLLANICMLIMALFDQTESYPVGVIKSLSTSVIVLNAILLFGSAILMVIGILRDLYTAYKERKKPHQQGVPPQIKHNRVNINMGSDKLQQNTSMQGLDYTRNYDYEPRRNHSQGIVGDNTTLYDLNTTTNMRNQMEISDLSCDINGRPSDVDNIPPNTMIANNYQVNNLEQQFESNTIDETMMNTSNVDLLPMRAAGSFTRPRIRGKIKMPGGVVWNPRSNNGTASPGFGFQSSPHNNIRPTNMEIARSPPGFESQLRSPGQKRNINSHEEFILERTRARINYHGTRRVSSIYEGNQGE